MRSSTIRSAIDPTIGDSSAGPRPTTLRQVINTEWLQSGQADFIGALRRHPVLLRDRSLLLNLAIEEYRAQHRLPDSLDLERHCRRFREFGSSIQRSIQRQLEAQRYIDDHPELLEALCSPKWPTAGEEIGNFHVLEELGFGAIAHVYLCRQLDVGNRTVVVKAAPFSSFEAAILGQLNHPNIIPIYSTGVVEENNLHYLCMPYCGRSTLSDLLDVAFHDGYPRRDTPISIAANRWTSDEQWPTTTGSRRLFAGFGFRSYTDGVLALAIQLADALDHAHRQYILHGDLKPSNVLITPSARPLLLDFNLSQDHANSSNVCGGTLPYMPPEHLRVVAGETAQHEKPPFDPRSDIYSFGALMYELLAGITPVTPSSQVSDPATVAERLLAKIKHGPPPIRRYNPLVSRRLESIVLQCLAFEASDRPATMSEVRKNLKAEMRSIAAIGRTARVRPLLFAAVVGLPLTLLAGAAAHVATKPAQFVINYEHGVQSASEGKLNEAIDHFASALRSNPSFAPARFQLGRTRIALGNFDLAINDFNHVARIENDAHSMAYLGYCFNRNGSTVAAIPWYEKAIQNGAVSAAIYNNLGASYVDAQTHLDYTEQIRRGEESLLKAIALDRDSLTIQLNIVRHAEAKSKIDSSYNPIGVWRHALAILNAAPEDPLVQSHVVGWYAAVRDYDVAQNASRSSERRAFSDAESTARQAFSELFQPIVPPRKDTATRDVAFSPGSSNRGRLAINRYFLEPLLLDVSQP